MESFLSNEVTILSAPTRHPVIGDTIRSKHSRPHFLDESWGRFWDFGAHCNNAPLVQDYTRDNTGSELPCC